MCKCVTRGGRVGILRRPDRWRRQLINPSACLFWGRVWFGEKIWEACLINRGNRSLGAVRHQENGSGLWKTTVTTSCSGFSHLEIPAPKAGKVCSSGARLGNRFRPSQQTECASRAEEECLRRVHSQPRRGKSLFFGSLYQTSFVVWLETNVINPILSMYFHTLWIFQTIFDLNLFKWKAQ